jgi:hypothetical protein
MHSLSYAAHSNYGSHSVHELFAAGITRLLRLNFVYIFSVITVGPFVYRCFVFDKLTGLFFVDVGSSVCGKFRTVFHC